MVKDRPAPEPAADTPDEPSAGFLAEASAGFRAILGSRDLRILVGLFGAQCVVAGRLGGVRECRSRSGCSA